jgi:class 3 adenylate cyclase/YHS domain-containing protein/DNA-binding transcriptional MerR regulator
MTLDELAALAGESPSELRRWHRLGLVHPSEGHSVGAQLERVRLIRFALNRGYTAEKLAAFMRSHGDLIGHFAERVAASTGEPVCRMDEAAVTAGLGQTDFEILRNVAGLGGQPQAYQEDIEALRTMKAALDAGIGIDVLAQMLRVFAGGTERIADGVNRLFHLYVHERLRAAGSSGVELMEQTTAISEPAIPLLEPTVLYFHRKGWERAFAEDMMLHLAEEATSPSEVPGELVRAFLFVDLSSFTPMTEAMGDTAAAQVVDRFAQLVRGGAARCSGQVFKQIGDEFMLVFPDGHCAAMCGLRIQEAAADEPRFPALRMGAHVGSVLYREGDYVGTAVNMAARVVAAANRHQFLVTEAVRRELGGLDVEVEACGAQRLKGLSEQLELFELSRSGGTATRAVDPVCRMELDEDSAMARLDWQGQTLLFCSEGCLRRFLDDPSGYSTTVAEGMTS